LKSDKQIAQVLFDKRLPKEKQIKHPNDKHKCCYFKEEFRQIKDETQVALYFFRIFCLLVCMRWAVESSFHIVDLLLREH